MAARINNWRFYVYELTDKCGQVMYVGKGSTNRLNAQKRNFSLDGYEVARFKRESDAYAYEVERIASVKPTLNKHIGGNGSKAAVNIVRLTKFEKLCEEFGTRKVAARLWLLFARDSNSDMSKVDEIRAVAYG